MTVVQEYKFGNTKVLICDDSFKSPKEIEQIEQRIANIVWRYLSKTEKDDED